jgi:hypothetical protein
MNIPFIICHLALLGCFFRIIFVPGKAGGPTYTVGFIALAYIIFDQVNTPWLF